MKKNILLLSTIIALFAVGIEGCKKNETTNNSNSPKVKTRTYDDIGTGATVTETYSYDDQGRLKTKTFTYSGAPTQQVSYTYESNKVTMVSGNGSNTTIYVLNNQGYAISRDNGTGTENYTYDSEGHLLTKGTYEAYTWNNGNMATDSFPAAFSTFTYLTDKTNTIGNENRGQSFLGKSSKNLAASTTQSGMTTPISYEYDAQNRVTKVTGSLYGWDLGTYTYY